MERSSRTLRPSLRHAHPPRALSRLGRGGACSASATPTSKPPPLAQAGRELPCLGTTHADHFGPVPVCRALTPEEVAADYEALTGAAIVGHFRTHGLDPKAMPAVLQAGHAPFTWGSSADKAVENAIALETCAGMALDTLALRADAPSLATHLLENTTCANTDPARTTDNPKAASDPDLPAMPFRHGPNQGPGRPPRLPDQTVRSRMDTCPQCLAHGGCVCSVLKRWSRWMF